MFSSRVGAVRRLAARVAACAAVAGLVCSSSVAWAGAGTSGCCPADLTDDGVVDAGDLSIVLGQWGAPGSGEASDLDGSGLVDAGDIATLLGAWGQCPTPGSASCLTTLVVGTVLFPDGTPAKDAIVLTQFGGDGVSAVDGSFSFEVTPESGASSLQLTAVASSAGVNYAGSTLVSPIVFDGVTNVGTLILSADAECGGQLGWLPGFGMPGVSDTVAAMTVFDDGSGPALYVGGTFTSAGGVPANRIARWDGDEWSALGNGSANGVNGGVIALAVFDDGSGPALYAGGSFTLAGGIAATCVAKWDGVSWSSLGTGAGNGVNGAVSALAVFDDGNGPALYAGGGFWTAGGAPANRIARWSGSSWSSLGSGPTNGTSDAVLDLTVFDDGNGPALYVGGLFTFAGGSAANRIAKWDGNSWSSLGSGLGNGVDGHVTSLAVFDSGSGSALYVGGEFTKAGNLTANHIAQWNGTEWSSLGTGLNNGVDGNVLTMAVFDDGTGPELYVGGDFAKAGGITSNRIARWSGQWWGPLGTRSAENEVETIGVNDSVVSLAIFDDGSGNGPSLIVGGSFTSATGIAANRVARWKSSSWSSLGIGAASGMNFQVLALTVFDDGTGPGLYAGGSFTTAGGVPANRIARWDGNGWSPLVSGSVNGVNGTVRALAVFDDGSGPALYVGGEFTVAGDIDANRIVKWDGTTWSRLGVGLTNGMNNNVLVLSVFDDGAGPKLYAGGAFTTAGGPAAKRIARWNGNTWSGLGTGIGNGIGNGEVRAMTVFDDGNGPALYVGGFFTVAGGSGANRIAKWNGSAWSTLGVGASNGLSGAVNALAVFDDGSGPAVYAGGLFSTAGGIAANNIAKWDGSTWSSLVAGSPSGTNGVIRVFSVIDDGNGPALYAGGAFTSAGSVAANNIATWNGTSWSTLGTASSNGASSEVRALRVFVDQGSGAPALYAAGYFASAGGAPASGIAKWGCTPAGGGPSE